MNIPEHVKKQAREAVYERETSAMIRSFRNSGEDVSHSSLFTQSESRKVDTRLRSANAKQQAREAVWDSEVCAHIRLVKDGGDLQVPATPSPDTQRMAGKVGQIHKCNHDLDLAHKSITQDHFGRE
jgi:hypothetical protein